MTPVAWVTADDVTEVIGREIGGEAQVTSKAQSWPVYVMSPDGSPVLEHSGYFIPWNKC